MRRVQRVLVQELQREEQQDVDGGEDAGLRKGRGVVVVPESARVGGRVEGVVQGCDQEEEVRDCGGDLG